MAAATASMPAPPSSAGTVSPSRSSVAELAKQRQIEPLGAVVLLRLRLDLVAHELADRLAEQRVLRGRVEQVDRATRRPRSARDRVVRAHRGYLLAGRRP